MTRLLILEFHGALYHVISRCDESKNIFQSSRDRGKFLSYPEFATEPYGQTINGCCLMENHYHIFIETPLQILSKIIRHFNGAYTNYIKQCLSKEAGYSLPENSLKFGLLTTDPAGLMPLFWNLCTGIANLTH